MVQLSLNSFWCQHEQFQSVRRIIAPPSCQVNKTQELTSLSISRSVSWSYTFVSITTSFFFETIGRRMTCEAPAPMMAPIMAQPIAIPPTAPALRRSPSQSQEEEARHIPVPTPVNVMKQA